jgi:hypothetical protein
MSLNYSYLYTWFWVCQWKITEENAPWPVSLSELYQSDICTKKIVKLEEKRKIKPINPPKKKSNP